MTHRLLSAVAFSAMLASGCGCQSRAIEGGGDVALPGAGGAPATGPGTAPPGTGAGPNVSAGQDTGDAPLIPVGTAAADPTPKTYIDIIERLAPPLEKEALNALAAELDQALAANGNDAVAWAARAAVASRECLHALVRPDQEPDLTEFKAALERAAKVAGEGQWKYLVEHQRASGARLENDAQGAVDHLKAAIKLQAAFVLGHIEYAQMMMLAGKYEDAEQVLETIVKRWPNEWQGWYTLARCYLALKKVPQAKPAIEKALQLRPDMMVLHESMLRIESLIFGEQKTEDTAQTVRNRIEQIRAGAKKHFHEAANLQAYRARTDEILLRFEAQRAQLLILDFDLLPAERQTYEHILGRLSEPTFRRQMVRLIGAGLPDSAQPQARACFLLAVVRLDEADLVRVDALRGMHENLAGRSARPWKDGERAAIAPLVEDGLIALLGTLDVTKDRAIRLRVCQALGKLPGSALSCGPELVDRVGAVAAELLALLAEHAFHESKKPEERDAAADEKRLERISDLVYELEVLEAALQEIHGLGAPSRPDFTDQAAVKAWLSHWMTWSAEITQRRATEGWTRPEKCGK